MKKYILILGMLLLSLILIGQPSNNGQGGTNGNAGGGGQGGGNSGNNGNCGSCVPIKFSGVLLILGCISGVYLFSKKRNNNKISKNMGNNIL